MLDFSVPKTTMYVNPSTFPGSTHVGGISAADFLSALHAIDAIYVADRAVLKAHYGRPSRWNDEARRMNADIEARREAAIVELEAAYNGQEVQS